MKATLKYILIPLISLMHLLHASITPKPSLNFAPLSIHNKEELIQQFMPLFILLEKRLQLPSTRFIYEEDYGEILNKFINHEIDLALLGPLPYLKLQKDYLGIEPIVAFKNSHGTSSYRCVLVQFGDQKITPHPPIKVALTQPFSTCGYYATNQLLKSHFQLDLHQQSFHYNLSHENALLAVIKGEATIAGVRDSIARSFHSLGIRTLAKSEPFPEFALVANTQTLSKETIRAIQQTLLTIDPTLFSGWGGIFKHGFEKIDRDAYKHMHVDFHHIPLHDKEP
jgi:phosphonate transport system substrate-binding protein